jgi:hypothetical protein
VAQVPKWNLPWVLADKGTLARGGSLSKAIISKKWCKGGVNGVLVDENVYWRRISEGQNNEIFGFVIGEFRENGRPVKLFYGQYSMSILSSPL